MHTLKEMLSIPYFSHITVLNEKANLETKITSADISETPDIDQFLAPHTLLITTAMAFQHDVKGLCALIKRLHELPAAGLAIKLGRFIDKIDPEVLSFADQLGFPILQIPTTHTLGNVCHQMLSYLWSNQIEELQFSIKIQQHFSTLLMEGADLQTLIKKLSQVLKNQTLLINPFGDVLAHSFKQKESIEPMHECISQMKKMEIFTKTPKQALHGSLKENAEISFSVYPIFVLYRPHLLVVLQSEHISYPYSQLLLEQVLIVLAFTIYKHHATKQNSLIAKEKLLKQLINPDTAISKTLLEEHQHLLLLSSHFYQIIYIGFDEFHFQNEKLRSEAYRFMFEYFDKYSHLYFLKAIVFPYHKEEKIIIFLQQKQANLMETIKRFQKKSDILPFSFSATISNPVQQLSSTWLAYIEAKNTYDQHLALQEKQFIRPYQSSDIQDLIQFIPYDHRQYFCINILKELAYDQEPAMLELRKTLKYYLNTQGDLSKTAKLLYIHRNTVKYRINKIEQILLNSLSSSEFSLQLRLALFLLEKSDPKFKS